MFPSNRVCIGLPAVGLSYVVPMSVRGSEVRGAHTSRSVSRTSVSLGSFIILPLSIPQDA